jgi:hypothetical protein
LAGAFSASHGASSFSASPESSICWPRLRLAPVVVDHALAHRDVGGALVLGEHRRVHVQSGHVGLVAELLEG